VISSRQSIWLLCAGAVVLACGPRAQSAASSDSSIAESIRSGSDSTALASSLNVSVGDEVRLSIHVTNSTDRPIELRFSSGQTHDFVILDASGAEVWRWSAERMFTQALQTRSLAAGESISYEERWSPDNASGTFTAVGRVASTNLPIEKRVEFTLP
jgi:hypothetical protein